MVRNKHPPCRSDLMDIKIKGIKLPVSFLFMDLLFFTSAEPQHRLYHTRFNPVLCASREISLEDVTSRVVWKKGHLLDNSKKKLKKKSNSRQDSCPDVPINSLATRKMLERLCLQSFLVSPHLFLQSSSQPKEKF